MNVKKEAITRGLRDLGLGEGSHVLVHSSFRAFGGVEGGPLTVVRALVETVATVMMPASTWERTAVWDAGGLVEGNAYSRKPWSDSPSVPLEHDTPIDKAIGVIPETLRQAYAVCRSSHPLQSFIAYGELADALCADGNDSEDVAPIRRLMDADGEALLIGVTHGSSTAVHLGETLAGRRLFTRHALTKEGVQAVRGGGDSSAFDELQPYVEQLERRTTVGRATLRCYRLRPYVEAARQLIERDPYALLCDCDRCRAHKARVSA